MTALYMRTMVRNCNDIILIFPQKGNRRWHLWNKKAKDP